MDAERASSAPALIAKMINPHINMKIKAIKISSMTGFQKKGATLVLMTFLSVALLILGLTMLQNGTLTRSLALQNLRRMQAQAAADAGFMDAFFQMQHKLDTENPWNDSNLPMATNLTLPGSGAVYSYTVDHNDPGNTNPITGGYAVVAQGGVGNITKTVHAWLFLDTLFMGLNVNQGVDIHNAGFEVYPPDSGSIMLSTNSTARDNVTLKDIPGGFPGDIAYPPSGDPDTIFNIMGLPPTGQVYPMWKETEFPMVPEPDWKDSVTPLTIDGNPVPPGYYTYSGDLGAGETLTITGPTYLYLDSSQTTLHNGSKIIIQSGGSLEVVLKGDLVVNNDAALINETDNSHSFLLLGLPTCDRIVLMNSSTTMAAIYAPQADVNLNNSGDFYGAVVANTFVMKTNSTFYYDTRLKNLLINEIGATFRVGHWWQE